MNSDWRTLNRSIENAASEMVALCSSAGAFSHGNCSAPEPLHEITALLKRYVVALKRTISLAGLCCCRCCGLGPLRRAPCVALCHRMRITCGALRGVKLKEASGVAVKPAISDKNSESLAGRPKVAVVKKTQPIPSGSSSTRTDED